MKLIKDLGQDYRQASSTVKVRYGLYECDFCHQPFKVATPDMKTGRIKSCGCQKLKSLQKEMHGFILVKDLGIIKENRMGIFTCKECGNDFTTRVSNIKTGRSNSCGCLPKNKIHGQSSNRIYQTWYGLKARCNKPGRRDQQYYYDKGIKLCDEWENSFIEFYQWSIENGYNDNLTIDRKNPEENYTPGNCRWVTMHTQATNKHKLNSRNKSGYRGVFFLKSQNKYITSIFIKGTKIQLGTFNTAKEGGDAYDQYIRDHNLKDYIQNKDLIK